MTDTATGKRPTQAMSKDRGGSNDGVEAPGGKSAGESSGGAYPNPHTGKDGKDRDDVGGGFLGHGGQSGMDYSGTGDGDTDDDVGNANAVTKSSHPIPSSSRRSPG